jgi:hypothetical protein
VVFSGSGLKGANNKFKLNKINIKTGKNIKSVIIVGFIKG